MSGQTHYRLREQEPDVVALGSNEATAHRLVQTFESSLLGVLTNSPISCWIAHALAIAISSAIHHSLAVPSANSGGDVDGKRCVKFPHHGQRVGGPGQHENGADTAEDRLQQNMRPGEVQGF